MRDARNIVVWQNLAARDDTGNGPWLGKLNNDGNLQLKNGKVGFAPQR